MAIISTRSIGVILLLTFHALVVILLVLWVNPAFGADADGDGVADVVDMCPNTIIPEAVPTVKLGVNRFALIDNDTIFDTTAPGGGQQSSLLTLDDTAGCSCSQIIEQLELGKGHEKFGCSIGAMEIFIAQLQPEPEPEPLRLLATGQTQPFPADKNDGIAGPVDVPDDGTFQFGAPLQYVDNGDGTITDLNTGLMWEKKCDTCPETDLHHVDQTMPWNVPGRCCLLKDTIWDWVDDVNAENGIGFAGYNDWRIPNIRELHSIVHYGSIILIDPIFAPTARLSYWSSTTFRRSLNEAWVVDFGRVVPVPKTRNNANDVTVRAVRGGL